MSDEPATTTTAASPTARRKPMALGRGLGALMGETRREEPLVSPSNRRDLRASAGRSGDAGDLVDHAASRPAPPPFR